MNTTTKILFQRDADLGFMDSKEPLPSNKPQQPSILICACGSTEHQLVFTPDIDKKIIYCHIHLVQYGFWRRLKKGIKYIFGYKCKYGNFEEIILSQQHSDKLTEFSQFLNQSTNANR